MRVSLVTLGDPATLTGGYLYHRRMAAAAAVNGASLSFVSFPAAPFPLPGLAGPVVSKRLGMQEPDVVVIDSIAAAFAAPWLRLFPRPVTAMLHQPPGGIDAGPIRTAAQSRLDLAVYRRCARILVASRALVGELTPLGIDEGDIVVVAPGRDLVPDRAAGLDLRRGRRVALLCVGNWVARKGIVELVEAYRSLPPDLATLHLVGGQSTEPRYAGRVKQLIDRDGLAGRVIEHGPLPSAHVAAMYAAADVFVLPSMREPYGTVYGEAMAAGLPVVGWRAGNLPHLAREGLDGLIVEPGDVEGLAGSLRKICEDDELRTRMAASARLRAKSFPTWEEAAALFFGELRSVLADSKQ